MTWQTSKKMQTLINTHSSGHSDQRAALPVETQAKMENKLSTQAEVFMGLRRIHWI